MRHRLRRIGVACVAASVFLWSCPPQPAAAAESADQLRALELLQQCAPHALPLAQVAAAGEADADASPSPSPSPSPYVPLPNAPAGPQILVPPQMSPSPAATPVPLPSPTATGSGSPAPVYVTPVTPPPSTSPTPSPTPTSGFYTPPSATPAASAAPAAQETLGPDSYAILGEKFTGVNKPGEPWDLDGNVNILYQDGALVGDHAHYDGKRWIDVTGNTYIRNRSGDTTLHADAVRFDTLQNRSVLLNGRGESTQGVERGKLYYKAVTLTTERSGVTHGERAFLTTCVNPRGGYHVESKTLDIYPGDKAIARSAVLYLGALAVLYLPIVVISLRTDKNGERRTPGFIPLIGYSQQEGFFVKARIGFAPADTYFGYYRVEAYTKIGLGLGYVGTLARKDGKRRSHVEFFRLKNKQVGTNNNNLQATDEENFSRSTRARFNLNYQSIYGPQITLPTQYQFSGAVDHGDVRGDTENYSYSRSSTVGFSSQNDYGATLHRAISKVLSQDATVSYSTNNTAGYSYAGQTIKTLHYQARSHLIGRSYDYDLNFERFDGAQAAQLQTEPELAIHRRDPFGSRLLPITADFRIGRFLDPQAQVGTTARGEAKFRVQPPTYRVFGSDLQASLDLQQDAYSTGDLKAQIGQSATLTTPMFGHMVSTLQYTNQHANGPLAEPFKTIDILSQGSKLLQESLRLFNNDVYSLSLTSSTQFNRMAQPVGYQLIARPSRRSSLQVGGSFFPGPGNGFTQTNVQLSTPFGRDADLQFGGFIDWKSRGRITQKAIFYRKTIGDCYQIRVAYNENLKQINVGIELLAFPSHALNFGVGQSASLGSIIPGNFSTDSFRLGQ